MTREPYVFHDNIWEKTLEIPETNFCCLGIGGSGKTVSCSRYALSKFKKVLGGAHNNHAVDNMSEKGIKNAFHRILEIRFEGAEECESTNDDPDSPEFRQGIYLNESVLSLMKSSPLHRTS